MRSSMILVLGILAVSAGSAADPAAAQQVTVSTPQSTINESFFEHTGTSWGLQGKNWFFQFGPRGNPNAAAPPFGGFAPSAGANFGFGFGGGGVNGGFLGNFSQGSRRSFTTVAPSVTVPNGGTGWITDTTISPFVTGYIPVVGGFPVVSYPVQPVLPAPTFVPPRAAPAHPAVAQALQNVAAGKAPLPPSEDLPADEEGGEFTLNGTEDSSPAPVSDDEAAHPPPEMDVSSAARPAMSVAEAERLRKAEESQRDVEAARFIERGRQAQEDGKLKVARMFYQAAARRASSTVRQEALARLRSLPAPETSR